MKTTILTCIIFMFLTSINVNAQLKVKTNGSVKIGSETPWNSEGKLDITGINTTLEARIFPQSANIARLWAMNSSYAYGFGIDNSYYGHIYGDANNPYSMMTFTPWGYFGIGRSPSYMLDVNGSIRVNTTIYSSDKRLKENISNINGYTDNLYKLRGVTYNFKKDKTKNERQATETMNPDKKIGKIIEEDNRQHFGFIAQEVRELFPELVYEDDKGYLGIDYVSFIPLIMEELKHQKNLMEELRNEILVLKQGGNILGSELNNEESANKLFQNVPNPFKNSTIIEYELQSNFNKASILIFNLQGTLITSYPLSASGKNQISIKGSELNPGMYLYSLIIDGKEIDTKRMILTE